MLARLDDRDSVCPSVCPSVTRVLCDETKEHTADILIPTEVGGRCPLPPEICA